jgi:deoxycytidylate deaminase
MTASYNTLCRRRPVAAVLVTPDGRIVIGRNNVANPQPVCPRDQAGHGPGSGWKLCREICRQRHHAEVDALEQAGEEARGGTVYLVGHEVACPDCAAALDKAGVALVIHNPVYSEETLKHLLGKLRKYQVD